MSVVYRWHQWDRVRCLDSDHYGQTGTVTFTVPGNGSNPHANVDLDNGGEVLLLEDELEAE